MNVLVVHCHPDPLSFVSAVRERVVETLHASGHDVRERDLYGEGFDPLFTAGEHERHRQPGVEPSLAGHADDLRWCDTLVLVYPTWWSAQPAMLKGWFDRVWACGVAWELPEGSSRIRPLLQNVRRIVAVTTHGSSKLVNAVQGEAGKRTVTRSLRLMCHRRCRTSWIALYGVDRSTMEERQRFLQRVERRIARL